MRPLQQRPPGAEEPDEDVLAVLGPHWWALVGPCLVVLAAMAIALALLRVEPPEVARLVAGVVLVGAAVRLVVRYARWRSTRLVVTTERLIHQRGVLARHVREVHLDDVTAVDRRQSLRQRLLRAGDLEVSVHGGAALVVADVPQVRAIAAGVDRARRRPSPPDATTAWRRG